ncbi:MAG: PdxA family dehydrogenase [Anaerolineae bacterium]|jgi:4-hydroxy-L-threonine phosphate dehydrogenase PdxA|nr:hypothetical protein [Chloroflexota bacterium]
MPLPRIALTMGDPAGIAPEIILRALSDPCLRGRCQPLILGDPAVMARAAALVPGAPVLRTVAQVDEPLAGGEIGVLPTCPAAPEEIPSAAINIDTARAMLAPLERACDLIEHGSIEGLVSGPLNKEAFSLCGLACSDELEFMAERLGCQGAYILGLMRGVWVASIAEHVRFRAIADLVTKENILRAISSLESLMRRAGVQDPKGDRPRIAVSALNPHAGEGGTLGTEEVTEIRPAVLEAQARGLAASGPYPADTVFARALEGQFEGVIAMFHDQANIARKLQPMSERVTLFEGLPVPVGTTAHGVAYDIAGRGIADPGSLTLALDWVIRLAAGTTR